MVLAGDEAAFSLTVGTGLVVSPVTVFHLVDHAADTQTNELRAHADTKGRWHVLT